MLRADKANALCTKLLCLSSISGSLGICSDLCSEWKSMERKGKSVETSCVRYETYTKIDLMISQETSKAKIQGQGCNSCSFTNQCIKNVRTGRCSMFNQIVGPFGNFRLRRHHCFAGVRAFMSRTPSAHFMIVPKDPESCGGTLANRTK